MGLSPSKDLNPSIPCWGFFYSRYFMYICVMRKYIYAIALGVTVTLTACGSGSSTNEVKDSTGVVVDSTAVQVDSVTGNDTTVGQIGTHDQPVK